MSRYCKILKNKNQSYKNVKYKLLVLTIIKTYYLSDEFANYLEFFFILFFFVRFEMSNDAVTY